MPLGWRGSNSASEAMMCRVTGLFTLEELGTDDAWLTLIAGRLPDEQQPGARSANGQGPEPSAGEWRGVTRLKQ